MMENMGSTVQQPPITTPSAPQAKPDQTNQNPPPQAPDFRGTKHKFKANGKEIEVPYEELILRASKAEGAEAKLQEAARDRKAYEERQKRRKDPNVDKEVLLKELIDELGEDRFYELSEEAVWKRMNYEKLSPAEKRAIEAEDRAAKLESEKAEREQNENKSRSEMMLQDSVKRIDRLVTDALEDAKKSDIIVADLPEAMELMLDEYMAHLEYLKDLEKQGYDIPKEELSHKAVLESIQSRYDERTLRYISKMPVSELRKRLSKEQIAGLRQEEVSSLHGGNILAPRTSQTQAKTDGLFQKKKPAPDQRRMSSKDAFARLDELHGGKRK
jgi:hypothetical protein